MFTAPRGGKPQNKRGSKGSCVPDKNSSLYLESMLAASCRGRSVGHKNPPPSQGGRQLDGAPVTVVHGKEQNLDNAILMEIENLRRASLAALRGKYREVFEEEARSRHREHLFRRIAWRLQALAEGDLSERARKRAQQIARDADLRMVAPRDFFTVGGETVRMTRGGQNRREPDSRLPLPGALLSRKWKGRNILVEVLAEGFRYENRHYPSLSAIAVAVTGTRWNGLAFFGLTRPVSGERKERLHAEK